MKRRKVFSMLLAAGLSVSMLGSTGTVFAEETTAEETTESVEEDAAAEETTDASAEETADASAESADAQESALSLGDTSIEAPSAEIDGTIYPQELANGASAFVYVPNCDEYGMRATAAPILQVYGSEPYTAETAKQTALDSGLAEIADHERGCVVFVNPIGDTWSAEDSGSYEAAKNLFSDATNNDEKISLYSTDGQSVTEAEDGTVTKAYPGSYSRNYIFAEGAGADFVYENIAAGVNGAGQFFGEATYKPVAALLMNPTSTEAVDLLATDDRQVPVVLVNSSTEMQEAFAALDTTAKCEVRTSEVTEGFEKASLLAAYDDVMEHYMMREMNCPVSLLEIPSSTDLGLTKTRVDYDLGNGKILTYYMWAPADGTEGKPLFLGMHGSANSAEALAWSSGLYMEAAENDFTLISFENYSNTNLTNEELMSVLKDVVDTTGADTSRIYCSGFSMGSMRTWALGCENQDFFAGQYNMNGFGSSSENTTYEQIMPAYVVAGRESYIAAFEFPAADNALLPSLLTANGVVDGEFTFDDSITWGIAPTSEREVACEDLDSTTGYISEYASLADETVYTVFADASYAGHEPLRYITEDAVNFLLQFSRNEDGTITVNK